MAAGSNHFEKKLEVKSLTPMEIKLSPEIMVQMYNLVGRTLVSVFLPNGIFVCTNHGKSVRTFDLFNNKMEDVHLELPTSIDYITRVPDHGYGVITQGKTLTIFKPWESKPLHSIDLPCNFDRLDRILVSPKDKNFILLHRLLSR